MYDYDDFKNKYSKKHKITEDQASEHNIVKYVKELNDENAKKTATEVRKEGEAL